MIVTTLRERSRSAAHEVRKRWGSLLSAINEDVVARDRDRTPLPRSFLTRAGAEGLQMLAVPAELGGEDVGPLKWGMVLEEVGYLCEDSAVPLALSIQATVARTLHMTGCAELIDTYAIPLTRGTRTAALAYTENADIFSLRTRLAEQHGTLRLNGEKTYVTGAMMADVLLTYAVDDNGELAVCLVPADDPDVQLVAADALGHRTSGAASVTFDNVVVNPYQVLRGQEGITHAQSLLNDRRLLVCCGPLGRTRAILERCVAHLATTTRYGEPVAHMKNVQHSLGRMFVAVESARSALYGALESFEAGECDPVFDLTVSATKHFVTEQIVSVTQEAFRILGGHAYYGDSQIGRQLRDCMGLMAAAGAQDVLAVALGAAAVAQWQGHPHPPTDSTDR